MVPIGYQILKASHNFKNTPQIKSKGTPSWDTD